MRESPPTPTAEPASWGLSAEAELPAQRLREWEAATQVEQAARAARERPAEKSASLPVRAPTLPFQPRRDRIRERDRWSALCNDGELNCLPLTAPSG